MKVQRVAWLTGGIVLGLVCSAWAEPAWTKNGDCTSCHTTVLPGVISVFGEDGTVDPDGGGPLPQLKVFRAERGQIKSLMAQVSGLAEQDPYGVELDHLQGGGAGGGILSYSADCDWAQWWGAKFYTDPAFSYKWGPGLTDFSYDIGIGALAAYDYYDLTFAVAGVMEATDELFYCEEHFYLQVIPAGAPPPTVTGAVSRKTHGLAGVFDLSLMFEPSVVAVEGRAGGPTKVLVTFSEAVQGRNGLDTSDVSLTSSSGSAGTVTNLTIDNQTLTIEMTGVPDDARLTIAFPGIEGLYGHQVVGTLCLGALAGDVSGDGMTNIFDLVAARNALNAPVAVSNFRADVNVDGLINIFDLVAIRNNLNRNVNGACP